MNIVIPGHCYSLKTSRTIFRSPRGRLFPGKSTKLKTYQEKAEFLMRLAWGKKTTLTDEFVGVTLRFYYSGPTPDALGPAETIFDCLQNAGVVENDRQLTPAGYPAILRFRVPKKQERVEIEIHDVEP